MLRFFIIAAEIIVLFVVLRSPFVQYFLEDIHQSISNYLTELASLPEREELAALREQIAQQLGPLKSYQVSYVERITADTTSLQRFQRTYCEKDDINPNFTGTKRAHLCLIIKQSPLLQKR